MFENHRWIDGQPRFERNFAAVEPLYDQPTTLYEREVFAITAESERNDWSLVANGAQFFARRRFVQVQFIALFVQAKQPLSIRQQDETEQGARQIDARSLFARSELPGSQHVFLAFFLREQR